MDPEVLIKIRSNPYLYRYLRENSYWYKALIRDPNSIKLMENEAKKYFKLNLSDKINDLGEKINTIKNLIDILK